MTGTVSRIWGIYQIYVQREPPDDGSGKASNDVLPPHPPEAQDHPDNQGVGSTTQTQTSTPLFATTIKLVLVENARNADAAAPPCISDATRLPRGGGAAACAEAVTCASHFSGGRIRGEPAGDPLAVAVVEGREFAGDDPGGFVHLLGCRGGVLVDEQAPQLA